MNEFVCLNFIKNDVSGEFVSVGFAHFDGKMIRLASNIDRIKDLVDDFEATKTDALTLLRKLKREFDYTNKTFSHDLILFTEKHQVKQLKLGKPFNSPEDNIEECFKITAELVLGPDYKRIDLFSSKDFVVCDCVALVRTEQPHYTSHHKECRFYDPIKDLTAAIDALVSDMDFIKLKYGIDVEELYSYQKAKFVLTGLWPMIKEKK